MHASSDFETGRGAALDAGEYFGTAAGARNAGAVTLTLTDYRPGTVGARPRARAPLLLLCLGRRVRRAWRRGLVHRVARYAGVSSGVGDALG